MDKFVPYPEGFYSICSDTKRDKAFLLNLTIFMLLKGSSILYSWQKLENNYYVVIVNP